VTDPPDRPDTHDRIDDRWEKYERWRRGDLHLPDPDQIIGEPGLGVPGEPTRVPWRAREAIGVFLLHLFAASIVTLVIAVFVADIDRLVIVGTVATEILLLATVLGWNAIRHRVGPGALGFRKFEGRLVLLGVGIGIAGRILASLISIFTALFVSEDEIVVPQQRPDPETLSLSYVVTAGLVVIILAPLAEEAFFRGFIYGGLRRWAKAGPAMVISSLFFSLAHVDPSGVDELVGSLIAFVPSIFVLGVLFARVVERHRSLVPSIVGHVVFNLAGFLALLFLA